MKDFTKDEVFALIAHSKIIVFLLLTGVALLVVAACTQAADPVVSISPTVALDVGTELPTAVPTEPVIAEPTAATEAEVSEEPGSGEEGQSPTEAAPAPEPLVKGCLDCHSNQEMLINTAAPVEAVESENEGEG